jgi:prepilin peptidase CpaA
MQNELEALSLLPACLLIATITIATLTDLVSHRIPNTLLAPALAFALLISAASGGVFGLGFSLAGMAVGLLMLLPVYAAGAMGAGDVKLLAVAGAYLGPEGALLAGLFTFIAGAVLGLLWMGRRFLPPVFDYCLGWFNGLVSGGVTGGQATSGDDTNVFAYAPAIASGVAIAFWQMGWQLPIGVGG